MASKVKVQVGDVFQIPIDNSRVGYGQVVARPEKNVLFICVFAATTAADLIPDLAEIVRSEILLAGNTFDAKFNHGHWSIVGNMTSNLVEIPLPHYKSGMAESVIVETLDRSRRRAATKEEEELLPFRTYSAPVGFELAIKAIAGNGVWLPDYDDLKYDKLKISSTIVV